MRFVRRSERPMIVAYLEEGLACRVGPYVCTYNRGNYEIRNSWFPERVFRTSSSVVAAAKLLQGGWKAADGSAA